MSPPTFPTDDQVEAAAKAIWESSEDRPAWYRTNEHWKNVSREESRAALQAVFTPEFVQQMAGRHIEPMSLAQVDKAIDDARLLSSHDMLTFAEGIAAAEKFHGIGDAAMRSAADKGDEK